MLIHRYMSTAQFNELNHVDLRIQCWIPNEYKYFMGKTKYIIKFSFEDLLKKKSTGKDEPPFESLAQRLCHS